MEWTWKVLTLKLERKGGTAQEGNQKQICLLIVPGYIVFSEESTIWIYLQSFLESFKRLNSGKILFFLLKVIWNHWLLLGFGEIMLPACLLSSQWVILPVCAFLYQLFTSKILFSFALALLRFLLAMGYHGINVAVLGPSADMQLSINCWIFSCLGQLFCLISIWSFYATIPWRMTGIHMGFIGISQLLLSAANAVICQVQ